VAIAVFLMKACSDSLNKRQLGHLGLTEDEESAVVAFLKTLTDGYQIPSAGKDK
jgi:cytochrome c peroxidase